MLLFQPFKTKSSTILKRHTNKVAHLNTQHRRQAWKFGCSLVTRLQLGRHQWSWVPRRIPTKLEGHRIVLFDTPPFKPFPSRKSHSHFFLISASLKVVSFPATSNLFPVSPLPKHGPPCPPRGDSHQHRSGHRTPSCWARQGGKTHVTLARSWCLTFGKGVLEGEIGGMVSSLRWCLIWFL